jgi:hypothetical protein
VKRSFSGVSRECAGLPRRNTLKAGSKDFGDFCDLGGPFGAGWVASWCSKHRCKLSRFSQMSREQTRVALISVPRRRQTK